MKVYLVEETGDEWEDAYEWRLGICATQERAIALVNETLTKKRNVQILEVGENSCCETNCTYMVSCEDSRNDNVMIFVYEIEVLE